VWTVLEQPSRRVAYHVDKELLDQVAERLPCQCTVVFPRIVGSQRRI
jgi:hypothetical protein